MITLITACGRDDLLKRTMDSLRSNQQYVDMNIFIHEEAWRNKLSLYDYDHAIIGTGKAGQHSSIERFCNNNTGKYYLHVEDDWEFNNSYNWIQKSIDIMEGDPKIIKVLARESSPHPCIHDQDGYGIIDPWAGPDGILWHGFSWNPGVTRLDLLKDFISFPKWEQELSESIHKAGYKVAELSIPVYKHIGDGRSTHQ